MDLERGSGNIVLKVMSTNQKRCYRNPDSNFTDYSELFLRVLVGFCVNHK